MSIPENEAPLPQANLRRPELVGCARSPRYWAASIDSTFALIVFFVFSSVAGQRIPKSRSNHDIVVGIAAASVYFAYFLFFEGLFSTTPGKKLNGLTIRHPDGSRCGFKVALIRTTARLLEVNPLWGALPAILCIHGTRLKQRLGDLLANSLVVRERDLLAE